MNIKNINYNELEKLLDKDYSYIVVDELCDEYAKDVKAISNFFKESKAVSKNFEFEEMYLFENREKKSLIISLEQDEMKATNLPFVQIMLLMQGIKIYWLSDFINDLNYAQKTNEIEI